MTKTRWKHKRLANLQNTMKLSATLMPKVVQRVIVTRRKKVMVMQAVVNVCSVRSNDCIIYL